MQLEKAKLEEVFDETKFTAEYSRLIGVEPGCITVTKVPFLSIPDCILIFNIEFALVLCE